VSKNFLKVLFLLGALSATAALLIFTLREATLPFFCGDVLFSKNYPLCTDSVEQTFTVALWGLTVLSVLIFSTIVFFEKSARKFFLNFLKFFVPFCIVALLIGFFVPICLGAWLGCFSLLPGMFALITFVFSAGLIASAFVLFFPPKFRILLAIVIFVALGFGNTVYGSFLVNLKEYIYDRNFENKAQQTGDISLCEETPIPRVRDRCVRSYAVSTQNEEACMKVIAVDEREECIAFVIRNRAIESLDTSLCKIIRMPEQVYVCQERINERRNTVKR